MTVRMRVLFVLTMVSYGLVGCGSNGSPSGPSTAAQAQSPLTASESAVIDACALIPAEDITRLLGVPVDGKSSPADPKRPQGCMWENPANYESVSLEIGSPGTAPNDTLPAPEEGFPEMTRPGPDGMRFMGPGSVVFAAGGRSNTVQVAVLSMLSGEQANDAAVELARKVGPQLPE